MCLDVHVMSIDGTKSLRDCCRSLSVVLAVTLICACSFGKSAGEKDKRDTVELR